MNQSSYRTATGRPFGRVGLSLLTAALMGSAWPNAQGEGFRNPPAGTFNLGRAGGRIAHIDDSSATTQNPANLTELDRTQIQLSPNIIYMSVDFDSPTGQSAKTENPWKGLLNGYLVIPWSESDVVFALGLTSPFGLSVDWDDDASSAFAPGTGIWRYSTPYYDELMTANFNPTVAFKLSEHFSLGVGVDVMWSRLTLKQFYPWAVFPGSGGTEPDGNLKGEGSGVGIGGNLALTWKINEKHTVAVTYRSQMDVNYSGDTTINNITPTAAALGVTSESDFGSSIAFPNMVAVGYGVQLTDSVRLEADVEWIQFSRFKTLEVDAANNNILLPPANRSIPENWKNTFTAGIGGDWTFASNWVVRASYQFYQTPVPDSTFSPSIPDANQNVITIGIGYHGKHNSFELAYGADFYADRNISTSYNPAFNGDYGITVHLMSFAYRYTF